ncbi:hypothetical protein EDM00_01090 [Ornithobacterium rhinotracheale]|uniref:hypothetical protein n=1 Tax=Ornithobacterium rhinotracheale TaxID=28251 RepID=UPI00129C601C|nr:hypothetical protein [Ornithobacterium rhinotracheale]MRI62597.1 hypothetical protein [Ornithobacterium rhinotracheale]MRJ07684.1 hypothetical protein [Ornithobacterium rhinotracheale]MRJ10316.1 hypothetical protein [Ornithobacterium rhinotracheale]UOH78280.1 hypothetical protein MT996_02130 [Ornithobacterium rhinotracheale]
MKNIKFTHFLIALFFSISLLSCKNTVKSQDLSMPLVINPEYHIYDTHGERGYEVSFELSKKSPRPVAIVLNKIKQDITKDDVKKGKKYKINVINSTQIKDYKIKVYNSIPNGLIYKQNDTYYLQPVFFNLKK